jgi:hypothetical protein
MVEIGKYAFFGIDYMNMNQESCILVNTWCKICTFYIKSEI